MFVMAIRQTYIKEIPNYSNYLITSEGQIFSLMTGKQMRIGNRQGYVTVILRDEEGRTKTHYLHRLVAQAFYGDIPDGMEINHLDEDKNNNALSNLSLIDHASNCRYGTRNKRISDGLRGKKKKRVQLQVNDAGEVKIFETIAQMCDAYPSQKRNTWYQRVNAQKEPRLFYESIESGRVIYISILNIIDPNNA